MTDTLRNILIVEDEALIAMELEMELTSNGFGVIGPAHTVQLALDMIDSNTVSAAILDVMLGRDEVFDVADRLAEKGIPFLFHSGHATRRSLQKRYEAPVFSKPAIMDQLLACLTTLTGDAAEC